MKVGSLNQMVELQTVTNTRTAEGAVVKQWATAANLRAEVKPLSAKELDSAHTLYQQSTHTITVRYHPAALDNQARVVYGSRVFEVNAATDLMERRRYVALLCTEVK